MDSPERARLVLLVSSKARDCDQVCEALAGGDVASIIIYSDEDDQSRFSQYCKDLVPKIQKEDIAAIIADEPEILDVSGADGVYLEKQKDELKDIIARFSPQKIVGCGALKNRHAAMLAGEQNPDFLFFGKIGGDTHPEPHHRNINLVEWWAELFEVPAIVLGGYNIGSVIECAASGAEFVALDSAVFDHPEGAGKGVEIANQLLAETARIGS